VSTSRYGLVVDALISAIDSATGVTVIDGPANQTLTADEYVVVGGTDDLDDAAGTIDQDWAGIGRQARNEAGLVACAVLVGSGGDVVKTARDRALVILGQIEDALRADPTLGGVLPAGWCQMTAATPSQRRNTNGLYVRLQFSVAYQSRI
jgi:hypothetical protein